MPKVKKQSKATAPKSSGRPLPKPLAAAPSRLDGFLELLDPDRVYIVHVDRQPVDFKRRIFMVPLAMNLAIAAGLIYRLTLVWRFYLDLLCIAFGIPTDPLVSIAGQPESALRMLVLTRAGTLLLDFLLFRYLGVWAWLFFVGDGINAPDPSPARWRAALGFQPREIVVRASRESAWAADDFWQSAAPLGASSLDPTAAVLRERIGPAIDPQWMGPRTGYMMMGRDFELDFAAMLHAHELLREVVSKTTEGGDSTESLGEHDFELSLLVYSKDLPGWCVWRLVEEGSATEADMSPNGKAAPGITIAGKSEAQARSHIEAVHARLTSVGQDQLFYRLVEIVQYESNQPGGLTPERRERVKAKARQAFTAAGADFGQFVDSIGGEDMLPGFD